jgi:hypothetical protein
MMGFRLRPPGRPIMGARMRAPMLAVTPSECAAASWCPVPGGDVREPGLHVLRLCGAAPGLYAFRKNPPTLRCGLRDPWEYRYSFYS